MIYAAIITLCMTTDLNSCQVLKHPATFTEESLCLDYMQIGLDTFGQKSPRFLEGYCIPFPVGDEA